MLEANDGTRLRNLILALGAIALSVALYFGWQSQATSLSLEAQARQSLPLEVALSNSQPTLTEFYADWCTSCQAMAGNLGQLKQEYTGAVNFVMLNVDNSKWLPEILRYRVDGIPHFLYFNRQGEAVAQTIGEQPLQVMEANLAALIADAPLPYAAATGQTSDFTVPVKPASGSQDPRSHGSQVK